MGIKKDINLTGDDYQWLGSMFYFGTEAIFDILDVNRLTEHRLHCMGVSHESTTTTSSPGQVFLALHHYVGLGAVLHGCGQELLRCTYC